MARFDHEQPRQLRGPRGDGSIILLGSISVHIKAVGESVYNAAKGGVARSPRVTLIEPGAIGSAMQPFPPERRAQLVAAHEPLPQEVAEAVLFAATRPASTA